MQFASPERLRRVYLIGGAGKPGSFFQVGPRNCEACKRALAKCGVVSAVQRIGGLGWRTAKLAVGSGQVLVLSEGKRELL